MAKIIGLGVLIGFVGAFFVGLSITAAVGSAHLGFAVTMAMWFIISPLLVMMMIAIRNSYKK